MSKSVVLHQCPVCGVIHEVSAVRAQLAYGRQLSCSGECESERRRRRRARYREAPVAARPGEPATVEALRIEREAATA
jgi:hypothetical protein